MSARKSERIMNLAICLLMARRFLPREQIRAAIEGYHGLSDGAFERTFERDKEELRALGVPVETGSNSPLFPDDIGYRISRDDFELPPIEFDAAETAALGLASTVWDSARLADDTVRAMSKLRAAGVQPDSDRVAGLAPRMGAHEPAFDALWQATLTRTRVRFTYRALDRTVEPWLLAYRRGAWYLLAFDTTRGEERLFKVSRVTGEPRLVGQARAYDVPEGDLEARLANLEPVPGGKEARVAIADGAAPDLRRRARPDATPAPFPGYSCYRLDYADVASLTGDLAAYGPQVIALAPAALRRSVIAQLKAVAGWGAA